MFDRKKFRAYVVLAGMTMEQLAKELGINCSTLYRKINRDGDFSREEIQKLKEVLNITNADEIFFADKLA